MQKETPAITAPSALITTFNKARIVGTPLIGITTFDNAASIESLAAFYNGKEHEPPILQWDIVRGVSGVNKIGKTLESRYDGMGVGDATPVLMGVDSFPEDAILFLHNIHHHFDNPMVLQGIWNARDLNKAAGRTFVLLAPDIILPADIQNDVLILDEKLPTEAELRELVVLHYENMRDVNKAMPELTPEMVERSVDALLGLSHYPAEQAFNLSLSVTKGGIDFKALWERKRQMVEQTPGLKVYRGEETFEDVAGLDNVKDYMLRMIGGRRRVRCIAWGDEIEKQLGGLGVGGGPGDSSGTTQDQLGVLLAWMQDTGARGVLFVGFPGGGKTLMAKATGNTAGCITVGIDLGGMKSGIVGSSESRVRQATKVVDAVGQGEVVVIFTCNSLSIIPPELRRRLGATFFFDLPEKTERRAAWALHSKLQGIEVDVASLGFDDEGYTAAEIAKICQMCADMGYTPAEAAGYIVPVFKAMAAQIQGIRQSASGCFISASQPGIYDVENTRPKTKNQNGGARTVRALTD